MSMQFFFSRASTFVCLQHSTLERAFSHGSCMANALPSANEERCAACSIPYQCSRARCCTSWRAGKFLQTCVLQYRLAVHWRKASRCWFSETREHHLPETERAWFRNQRSLQRIRDQTRVEEPETGHYEHHLVWTELETECCRACLDRQNWC